MKSFFGQLTITVSLFTFLFISQSCGNVNNKSQSSENNKQTIMVYAAASLTDVLSEIIDSFEVNYAVKVQTNMASSGTLARQIEQGGTPDIYISANSKWADYIDSIGGFLPGSKSQIAQNDLVLIAPKNSNTSVETIDSSLNLLSIIGDDRISIGDPSHVPAGKYAKQSLEYYGWYSKLNNKILPAKDVRSALMVVELGESPIGIVYLTDALKSKKVKILSTFPQCSHKPIEYIGGIGKESQAAEDFFNFIKSDKTAAIWEKYGFK